MKSRIRVRHRRHILCVFPRYGPQDHLGREAKAAERPGGVGHNGILGRVVAGAPLPPGHAAPLNATDPHAEMLEWCGPDFDPNAVDEAAIRKQLNRLTPRRKSKITASR